MRKLLKISISVIMISGLLVGCGNSETNENKEEVKSKSAMKEQEVGAEQENQALLEWESSENFGEWITKSIEILEGNLDDPRIEQSGNDEGFTYYLKIEEIANLRDEMEVWAEGKAMGEDMSNLFMLNSLINHLQFSRTAHLGNNGEAIEAVELVEQWKPTDVEMRKAYEYTVQLFHDLDIAVNHDGKGEVYGVTHTLNGDKVSEMTKIWKGGGIPASKLEIGLFTYGEDGSSGYDSLESFIRDLSDKWAHDSHFRENQMDYSAEMQLVEQSLYDIAYFENEINELGLSELFGDLQQTAFEMVVNDNKEGDTELHDKLAAKYGTYLQAIIDEARK
ncbi:hypothetical protein [Oceanobacillus kapialis]|uniref:hypothetical protein n=1 Tax=Oceanobacillus kapialis TaxID=481353 RepID=UPI00384C7730